MAGLDDLSRGELPGILKRLRILETASPLQNASIGEGGLRVHSGGVITIENGGLKVTGSIDVIGELIASGILTFTGTLTQEGESTFTGATHFEGDTDVTGQLDVDGPMTTTGTLSVENVTTLKSDLNVTTGKVKVGSAMTLDPSVSSGALVFSNGAQVFTDATTVQMFKGGSVVQIDSSSAKLQATGGYVNVDSAGVRIDGPLRNSSGATISGVTANVYMDPTTGAIKRIV